jgi:prepilin-type N-terminal cleavage/methylation domain-containing protein
MKKMLRKEGGFTLIELLIVLAIMGILVGIVAMSVGNLTETAKDRGVASELQIVQTAIDTYNTQDVAVGPGPTIPERTADNAAIISVPGDWDADGDKVVDEGAAAPFAKYLRRDTKYNFSWGAGGEDLTSPDLPAAD